MTKRGVKKRLWLSLLILSVALGSILGWIQMLEAACVPRTGCSRSLAYYEVVQGDTLNDLVGRFQTTIDDVKQYNTIADINSIQNGNYILFPFPCNCEGKLLGYSFLYEVKLDDTVADIARRNYEGLTRKEWIAAASDLQQVDYIFPGSHLKIPINCSCGNLNVSPNYGLFITYAATISDNFSSLATRFAIGEDLLRQYNPLLDSTGYLSSQDIIFIPARDAVTGLYPPYNSSDDDGGSTGSSLIVGVTVGGGLAILLVAAFLVSLFCLFCPIKRIPNKDEVQTGMEVVPMEAGYNSSGENGKSGMFTFSNERRTSTPVAGPPTLSDFTVDKSVEFSFEELAAATDNFSVANKIGEGGYGAVYYANLRGQKLAVKRMNLQATREFLAELQVLTHVHHTNLVQLIGYCTVESLFLIYEYVENGTLDRHLHGTHDLPPLLWSARVQIALDAARGLEYIHEHTKPTYIHRDVKSSNILIDKQFHAKVADFGLTKLTESGIGSFSLTLPTRLVGTFGYMSPEYARFGDVSPKVDVYSFGVVLFEIISAKEAIVRTAGNSSSSVAPQKEEQRGLVTLFEEVLKDLNGREKLRSLVDPSLGNNYPLESAWKMAQLAGACTQENPELRPSMRTAVVALMTLSSTTQDWEMSAYGSDAVMLGLISGR